MKFERGFSPEEVITGGELLGVKENENYPDQEIEIYWFDNYAWEVPVDRVTRRPITAWKSHKAKKEFGR